MRRWSFIPLVLAALIAPEKAAAAVLYSIIDLGPLPGEEDESQAFAVNDTGQAAGRSRFAAQYHAVRWSKDGAVQDLGVLPLHGYSQAFDINNAGQVVGASTSEFDTRAFLWSSGVMQDLGSLSGDPHEYTAAYGVNNLGQVVGVSGAQSGNRGFLWNDGAMQDIGDLPGGAGVTVAYAINDAGTVVGFSDTAAGEHAFLWEAGVMRDLGALGGEFDESYAFDINTAGQIVGYSFASSGYHAFLWSDGIMQDLGYLPGGAEGYSRAEAINDAGLVVGYSDSPTGFSAFLWSTADGMQNLNDLIDPAEGWRLQEAYGINASGQIVGAGYHNNDTGIAHGFLLTPLASVVPEPATWALMIAGFGLVGGAMRGAGAQRIIAA